MNSFVFGLRDINKSQLSLAGGKGANLGELSRINGINVPDGFCISTEIFNQVVGTNPGFVKLLNQLLLLKVEERKKIGHLSGEIRKLIEGFTVPQRIGDEISLQLSRLGKETAFAVRSSATAEDLPAASFAGQQDSYLNIIGKKEILRHISKCWASLFTERAVTYRLQNGLDHRKVQLAVIVQKMVLPQVSGILFTADPVNANRKVISIDASFGLGEALVSGLVNSDNYKVRENKIIDKKISVKKIAIYPSKTGGTEEYEIEPAQQNTQSLTDGQIMQLAGIGRKIEEHFGRPQDIEWCLANDTFYIVQSRPITTLYPIPHANDQGNHVYVSVGHQQMMMDPIKPLGLSFFQLTAARPMYHAGGRLFVDIIDDLSSLPRRNILMNVLGKSDPLFKDALSTIVQREEYLESTSEQVGAKSNPGPPPPNYQAQIEDDPKIVSELIEESERSLENLKRNIQSKSGTALFDFILEEIQQLKNSLSAPKSFGAIMTGMNAVSWINEKMEEWLGEKKVADTITQSVTNNITSQMGLALLDVADVIRPHPEVVEFLQKVMDDNFLEQLPNFEGGKEARSAIEIFLAKYGMRCAGEIDITKSRWSEKPSTLLPIILSHVKNFESGASLLKTETGREQAMKMEQEVLRRLKQLPDGESKVEETKQKIGLLRTFVGYREFPKYDKISRYFVFKKALQEEAERLVQSGVIKELEDIYYLTLEELREVVRTQVSDYQIINQRKEDYQLYEKLNPPRVITSDGEIITGKYNRTDLPENAIAGLAVSAGVVEGRARVILNMADANLEPGDILVTAFTDPSWTPLFISIQGLVTEVGGLMTHGAVIAREYGLPAVVGAENATRLIKDGQRIRVNGTNGYVEILS